MDTLQRARCASDSKCIANRASTFYSVGNVTTARTVSLSSSPSIDYLAQLTVEISITPDHKTGKRYEMTVYHTKTKSKWRRARSMEEYLLFQSHLLDAMDQGHFCLAECPSLYTFLVHSFPKPMLFGFRSVRVMERRRMALATSISTLQRVLLSPSSQSCHVLTDQVAATFVGFLYGQDPLTTNQHPWEQVSPTAKAGRAFGSSHSEEEEESDDEHNNQEETQVSIAVKGEDKDISSSVDTDTVSDALDATPKHSMQAYPLTPDSQSHGSSFWTDGDEKFDETRRQWLVRNVRTRLTKTSSMCTVPLPQVFQSFCQRLSKNTANNSSNSIVF